MAGGILAAVSVLACTALKPAAEMRFDAAAGYLFAQEVDASQPMLKLTNNQYQTLYDIGTTTVTLPLIVNDLEATVLQMEDADAEVAL